MTFVELQKKIRSLVAENEPSLSAYLACAKDLQKIDDDVPSYFRTVRAAFLSSYNIQGLAEVYRARGVSHNLIGETYTAPYRAFTQIVIDSESDLYKFSPNVIYVLIDTPEIVHDKYDVSELIEILCTHTTSHIIVSSFFSGQADGGSMAHNETRRLEAQFKGNHHVTFFDMEKLDILERFWYTKYKELGDFRIAPGAFPLLAEHLLAYGVGAAGVAKKCAVVDLDNTLWQGIAGEDGITGIVPDKKIQQYLLSLFERGIILAINSKNNEEDAMQIFDEHPDMVLRRKHFAAWRINWQTKEQNIGELAEELNLGTDSFVCIDDDPFQRESVAASFPEIAVLPPEFLLGYAGFYSFVRTEEDRRRGAMYAQERMRTELKRSLRTQEDFLKELNLQLTVADATDESIARISQLTQKTNQFNLTTRRYSEDEIKKKIHEGWHVWSVHVVDRFGDYGVVGVVMAEVKGGVWRIDNFLLSCRVLGRGVEDRMIEYLHQQARAEGVTALEGEYRASAKNQQTENFWERMGYMRIGGLKTIPAEAVISKYYEYQIT